MLILLNLRMLESSPDMISSAAAVWRCSWIVKLTWMQLPDLFKLYFCSFISLVYRQQHQTGGKHAKRALQAEVPVAVQRLSRVTATNNNSRCIRVCLSLRFLFRRDALWISCFPVWCTDRQHTLKLYKALPSVDEITVSSVRCGLSPVH